MLKNKNKWYLILIIIILISAAINLLSFTTGHDWGDDFALYILQAKSIIEGNPHQILSENTYTTIHSAWVLGPTLYPWGFPLILAPVFFVFGLNFFSMKIYCLLFFIGSLLIIFYLFADKLKQIFVLMIISIIAFNPYFIHFNDNILSDIPFLFFSLLTLYYIEKSIIIKKWPKKMKSIYILLGILISITYLIRLNGIVFIPLLFLCQAYEYRNDIRKDLSTFIVKNSNQLLPYFTFLIIVFLNNIILPQSSGSHGLLLSTINIHTIIDNTLYYINLSAEFFGNFHPKLLFIISLPFLIRGIIKNAKLTYLYILFISFTFITYIIWPSIGPLRFLIPIYPFLLLWMFYGFSFNIRYLFTAILILLFVSEDLPFIYPLSFHRVREINTKESEEMFQYIKSYTQPRDLIVFRKPRAMRLITGRDSIAQNKLEDIKRLHRNSYIAIDEDVSRRQYNTDNIMINKQSNYIKPVFLNSRFIIYRII